MIGALDAAGIRFGQVSASHPTLDDVYLHFVGHTFGDTSTGSGTGNAASHDRSSSMTTIALHGALPAPARAGWFTQAGQVLRRWLISTCVRSGDR